MEKANSSHIISVFGRSVENIHRKLVNVYIKVGHDVSTINRWVSRVNVCPKEKWETDLSDKTHSGKPAINMDKDKAK